MKKHLTVIRSSLGKTYSRRRDLLAGLLLAFAAFALFVLVPVWTTPGNDIRFQLSLLTRGTLTAMVLLSVTNAVLISMHLHLRRVKARVATQETVGGLAVLGSSIIATLGCASCYSTILSAFGLGGIIFFGKYHAYIVTAVIVLSGFAVWHTARRIEGLCDRCVV